MIDFDTTQLKRLGELMANDHKKLKSELMRAVNATAKKTESLMAKEISKELATTQKEIKQKIKITKRADKGELNISAVVTVAKTSRLPMRLFTPKQNKAGVTYRISKTKGRKTVLEAFQGPKIGVQKVAWRGNAFRRKGKSRLPIVKLRGPSPWGVFVKNNQKPAVEVKAGDELMKQVERRIRFHVLKQAGKLNWQQ